MTAIVLFQINFQGGSGRYRISGETSKLGVRKKTGHIGSGNNERHHSGNYRGNRTTSRDCYSNVGRRRASNLSSKHQCSTVMAKLHERYIPLPILTRRRLFGRTATRGLARANGPLPRNMYLSRRGIISWELNRMTYTTRWSNSWRKRGAMAA